MAKKKNKQKIDGPCPIASVIEVFGGKWKSSILYHLEQRGTLRFSELHRLIPEVSKRMLTLQLRELERDGLVQREYFPEIPPRVEYSARAVASSLAPVFQVIDDWGKKNLKAIYKSRRGYDSSAN
ncbi:MAG: helix-turn-helix domain-containing protein [Planctomycetota bacterium]